MNKSFKWTIDKQFDFCFGHRVWSQDLNTKYSLDSCLACRHLHGHQGKVKLFLAANELQKGHYLIYAEKDQKVDILIKRLKNKSMDSVLVFTRTKHGADKLVRKLTKAKISALAIHGDKSQGARQLALEQFKNKKTRVLIATDIAARGIDIDNLPCVINFDLPAVPETYIHRIGRTGRSGSKGLALSLCSTEEAKQLKDIEKLLGKKIPEFTEETN